MVMGGKSTTTNLLNSIVTTNNLKAWIYEQLSVVLPLIIETSLWNRQRSVRKSQSKFRVVEPTPKGFIYKHFCMLGSGNIVDEKVER